MKGGISTGSLQSIAGADSAFCLHYKKLPCQTRLAGRILQVFCWGRKGKSDPPRGAGDLRLHWGKKASQTRLSVRTRELGLSVNAVIATLPYSGIRKQVTYHLNLSYWCFRIIPSMLFFQKILCINILLRDMLGKTSFYSIDVSGNDKTQFALTRKVT